MAVFMNAKGTQNSVFRLENVDLKSLVSTVTSTASGSIHP